MLTTFENCSKIYRSVKTFFGLSKKVISLDIEKTFTKKNYKKKIIQNSKKKCSKNTKKTSVHVLTSGLDCLPYNLELIQLLPFFKLWLLLFLLIFSSECHFLNPLTWTMFTLVLVINCFYFFSTSVFFNAFLNLKHLNPFLFFILKTYFNELVLKIYEFFERCFIFAIRGRYCSFKFLILFFQNVLKDLK